MKKVFILILSTFFFNAGIAQTNAIKITNSNTGKEKIIKENKRIKLKTVDGQKIKGRVTIENDSTIIVDNIQIDLKDIDALKNNPLFTSIFTSGVLIYGGGLAVGFGAIIAAVGNLSGLWLAVPAAVMIYTGIKSPNFNKNHTKDKGWTFEIVTISDQNALQNQ